MRRPTTIAIVGGPHDGQLLEVPPGGSTFAAMHLVADLGELMVPCVHYWTFDPPRGSHTVMRGDVFQARVDELSEGCGVSK